MTYKSPCFFFRWFLEFVVQKFHSAYLMQAFFVKRQSGPCFPVVNAGDAYDLERFVTEPQRQAGADSRSAGMMQQAARVWPAVVLTEYTAVRLWQGVNALNQPFRVRPAPAERG